MDRKLKVNFLAVAKNELEEKTNRIKLSFYTSNKCRLFSNYTNHKKMLRTEKNSVTYFLYKLIDVSLAYFNRFFLSYLLDIHWVKKYCISLSDTLSGLRFVYLLNGSSMFYI